LTFSSLITFTLVLIDLIDSNVKHEDIQDKNIDAYNHRILYTFLQNIEKISNLTG